MSLALPHLQQSKNLQLSQDEIRIVSRWPGLTRWRRGLAKVSWITYGDMLADIIFLIK